MEQIQQLIEILKQTPEMALWGIGMFFLWTLLKLASVTTAITVVAKLAINKYYNYKEQQIQLEREKLEHESSNRISNYFKDNKISSVSESRIMDLISSLKRKDGYGYIHESDITNAIKAIEDSKQ